MNADAVIYNLNEAVTSLLTGPALHDIAKNPDGTLVTEKIDDYTFKIFTGHNGNPDDPMPWPLLPYGLSLQVGVHRLADVVAGGEGRQGRSPPSRGHRTVQGRPSSAPAIASVSCATTTTGCRAPNGDRLPYLDCDRVPRDPRSARAPARRCSPGDIDVVSTSDGTACRSSPRTTISRPLLQDRYSETNHVMLHVGKEGSPLGDRDVRCAPLPGVDWET